MTETPEWLRPALNPVLFEENDPAPDRTSMTERQYVYKIVEVVKVTDGDTYWLRIDAGFRAHILINVRLLGYDCPEAHRGTDYEKAQAVKARDEALAWLTAGGKGSIWIRTEKDPDNFGRWLGEIWYEDPWDITEGLGNYLRDIGLASVWPTRWRDEYDSTKSGIE